MVASLVNTQERKESKRDESRVIVVVTNVT